MSLGAIAAALAGVLAAVSPAGAQQGARPGGLARHAMVGAAVEPLGGDSGGVRVTSVRPEFTAASLGLRAGDIILEVDGRRIGSLIDYARAFRAWRAPGRANVVVARGGARTVLRGAIVARPNETGEGIEVRYESFVTDSADRVRSLVARPVGATGRLPAVLFVGWLSCSSVELPEEAGLPGWRHLLHGLVRAGYLVLRVEKPGVGDSRGPDCSELGYAREVAAYRTALRELRSRADVDTTRVFVFGASLGGATAPGIAADTPVTGIVVYGTLGRTWLEHILDHERRRMELEGRPGPEVHRRMQALEGLYARYLVGGELPGDVIRSRPDYAEVWTEPGAHQYGRPATYLQAVQRANVAAAWDSVRSPVLVLYGSNDWIMAREDHETIARVVNARRPGAAELVIVDGADHDVMRYASREQAFRGEGGVPAVEVVGIVARWLDGASPTAASPRPAETSSTAGTRREVLAVLERLARAMETRDTALLLRQFLPAARLVGMRPRESGAALQDLTAQQFAEFLANDRRGRWVERVYEPEVRIDGTLATVWARYDFRFGDRLSHCGTDAFQLLRGPEGWRIASLADTYRTEGCS